MEEDQAQREKLEVFKEDIKRLKEMVEEERARERKEREDLLKDKNRLEQLLEEERQKQQNHEDAMHSEIQVCFAFAH